jgi:hypothetical protein
MPQQVGPWPQNLNVHPLAGGSVKNVPPGLATAGVGRIVLAPGVWLSALTTPGPLLAVVEAGTVDLAVDDGPAWVRSGANGASQDRAAGPLQTGDGALLPPGATVALLNGGAAPAVVLVVAISRAQ